MRKNFFKVIYTLSLFCLMSIFMLLNGCNKGGQDSNIDNDDNFVSPIVGIDRHIKKGDALFDYLFEIEQGVSVDTSAVDINEVGKYDIIYKKQGADDLKKTAYVYGEPTIVNMSGDELIDKTLDYKTANVIGLNNAFGLQIVGKDSFGVTLSVYVDKITKTTSELNQKVIEKYDGEDGDYTVEYYAIDKAGNRTNLSITYAIQSADAPQINDITADLGNLKTTISVDWGMAADIIDLQIDGISVNSTNFKDLPTGFTLVMSAFNQNNLEAKSQYNIRIITDLWYADFIANIKDEMQPNYDVFSRWIFTESNMVSLQLPQRYTAQRYEFEYEMKENNSIFDIDTSGKMIVITKKDGSNITKGNYVLNVKAIRGGNLARINECKFTVYDAEEYAKTLSPLTSMQFTGDLTCTISSATFNYGYLSENGTYEFAHKYQIPNDSLHPYNQVKLNMGTLTGIKFAAGVGKFSYYAFDIKYDKSSAKVDIWSFLCGATGQSLSKGAVIIDASGKPTSYESMQVGSWYTAYFPLYGSDMTAYFSCINSGISSTVTMYIRNFRLSNFVELSLYNNAVYNVDDSTGLIIPEGYTVKKGGESLELNKDRLLLLDKTGIFTAESVDGDVMTFFVYSDNVQQLFDNGIYEVNGENSILIPANYTLKKNGQNVALPSDRQFVLNETGEYTASNGSDTINFTIYSAEDFASIVAPLTSTQFDYDFKAGGSVLPTFTYNESEQAYLYSSIGNYSSSFVALVFGGVVKEKLTVGIPIYEYFAFDIKYLDLTKKAGFVSFFLNGTQGNSPVATTMTSQGVIIKDNDGNIVSYSNMKAGEWYTVYMPANAIVPDSLTPRFTSGAAGEMYLRNFRFTDKIAGGTLSNNNIYQVDEAKSIEIPDGYTVTRDGQEVTLDDGQLYLNQAGVYIASNGSDTISFTIYSTEDFASIVAPLTNTQFDYDFKTGGSVLPTFTYNESEQAYLYSSTGNYSSSFVALVFGGVVKEKLTVGIPIYEYFAFDIKYLDLTKKAGFVSFFLNGTQGNSPVATTMTSQGVVIKDNDGNIVSYSNMKAGEWYTVYMPANAIVPDSLTPRFTSGAAGEMYLRNFRFTD